MEIVKRIHEMDLNIQDLYINEYGNIVIEVEEHRFMVLYPMRGDRYKLISTISPPEPVNVYNQNDALKKIKDIVDVYRRSDEENQ